MVDLETIWLTIYGNELGNHMVDVDNQIVKRCVEPKARIPLRGILALGSSRPILLVGPRVNFFTK